MTLNPGTIGTRDTNQGAPRVTIPPPISVDVNSALGWGAGTWEFHTRYLRAGQGAWTFDVVVSEPAPAGGLTVPISLYDPEGASPSYVTVTSSVTILEGQTSATVTVTPLTQTNWFREKWVRIDIGEDPDIRPSSDAVWLCIFASRATPELSLTTDATPEVENAGDTVTLNYTVDTSEYADDLDHTLIKLSGTLADKFTWDKTSRIAAGSTAGTLTLVYDGTGSASDTVTIDLDYYQPAAVDFSQKLFDPDTGTSADYDGPVHPVLKWENQFRSSCGHNVDRSRPERRGLMKTGMSGARIGTPGFPTNLASGGIAVNPDQGEYSKYSPQTVRAPYREPWFKSIVRAIRPPFISLGDSANGQGTPYVRMEFDSQWCGGSEAFHKCRDYYFCGYCISEWDGDEAASRDVVFHEIGVRIRSKNRDHGIVLATDRVPSKVGTADDQVEVGKNKWGVSGMPQWTVNGVTYWLWDVLRDHATSQGTDSTCHPDSTMVNDADGTGSNLASEGDYGVIDLSNHPLGNFGAFIWFKHHIDSGVTYTAGGPDQGPGPADNVETPGLDDCNMIARPYRRNATDGAGGAPGDKESTETIDGGIDLEDRVDTDGAGVLAHSFYTRSTDIDLTADALFTGGDFLPWPNRGATFDPVGGCTLSATSGTVTITHPSTNLRVLSGMWMDWLFDESGTTTTMPNTDPNVLFTTPPGPGHSDAVAAMDLVLDSGTNGTQWVWGTDGTHGNYLEFTGNGTTGASARADIRAESVLWKAGSGTANENDWVNGVKATDAFTIDMWIEIQDLSHSDGPGRLLVLSNAGGPGEDFIFGINDFNYAHPNNADFEIRLETSGGSADWVITDAITSTGVYHVCYTWDGSLADGVGTESEKLWVTKHNDTVSASPDHTNTGRNGNIDSVWGSNNEMLVGSSDANNRPFMGRVFRMSFYDKALSQAEVEQNFAAGANAATS